MLLILMLIWANHLIQTAQNKIEFLLFFKQMGIFRNLRQNLMVELKTNQYSQDYTFLKLDCLYMNHMNIKFRNKRNYLILLQSCNMCDCIIISREHYLIEKNGSRLNYNDVGTNIWFPNQRSDRHTEYNDITLLEIWIIFAQEHFTNGNYFFPEKIRKSLKYYPMKAVKKRTFQILLMLILFTGIRIGIFSLGYILWRCIYWI
jgi:hypothetical protein